MQTLDQIRACYLNDDGSCNVSEAEARMHLAHSGDNTFPGDFTPLLVSDMQAILKHYEGGNISYSPSLHPNSNLEFDVISNTPISESLDGELATSTPSYIGNRILNPFSIPNKDEVPISDMDFEALSKEIPFGELKPALPGTLFKTSIRTPTASGFINDLGLSVYEQAKLQSTAATDTKGEFVARYPGNSIALPIPIACELRKALNLKSVAKPNINDPLIWRGVKEVREHDIVYSFDQLEQDSPILKVNKELLKVRKEEQTYWSKVLPLPERINYLVDDAISRGKIEEAASIIISYMGQTDTNSNLTNFRYVCNNHFGKMLKKLALQNKLPFLINELRAGHCDLASWYAAAVLRGKGIPAWATTDLLTTKDGSAFNGSYTHSTVAFANENGFLRNFDPTTAIKIDKAFLPHVMDNSIVDELERKLSLAKSPQAIAKVAHEFNTEVLPRLRKIADSNDETMKVMERLSGGMFNSLLYPGNSEFDRSRAALNVRTQSLDLLPNEYSQENLLALFKNLGRVDVDLSRFVDAKLKIEREQHAWMMRALNKLRINSSYVPFTSVKEAIVRDIFSSSFVSKPISVDMIDYRSSEHLLNAVIKTSERIAMIKNSHLAISDWCSSSKKYAQIIEGYKYTDKLFEIVSEGFIPISFDYDNNYYEFLSYNGKEIVIDFDNLDPRIGADFQIFLIELQIACEDSKYRQIFTRKFSLTNEEFTNLITVFFHRGTLENLSRIEMDQIPSSKIETFSPAYEYVNNDLSDILELTPSCKKRFRLYVRGIISKLDLNFSNTNVTRNEGYREYAQGDDTRHLDWNVFARLRQPWVRQSPIKAKEISTPLYVVFDTNCFSPNDSSQDLLMLQLQQIEIIKYLQNEVKEGRRIYIAFPDSDYYKLPQNLSALEVFRRLSVPKRKTKGPFSVKTNSQTPPNLLFVGVNHLHISMCKALYGKKCNLQTMFLKSDEAAVYPLVKQEWVETGERPSANRFYKSKS